MTGSGAAGVTSLALYSPPGDACLLPSPEAPSAVTGDPCAKEDGLLPSPPSDFIRSSMARRRTARRTLEPDISVCGKWHSLHSSPKRQPRRERKNLHGVHSPVAWSVDPVLISSPSTATPADVAEAVRYPLLVWLCDHADSCVVVEPDCELL